MSLLVARQPIFDEQKNVFGYEILYRSNAEQHFADSNDDQATNHVLTNAFMFIGVEELTEKIETGELTQVYFEAVKWTTQLAREM